MLIVISLIASFVQQQVSCMEERVNWIICSYGNYVHVLGLDNLESDQALKPKFLANRAPERRTVTSTTPRGGAVADSELQRDRLTS